MICSSFFFLSHKVKDPRLCTFAGKILFAQVDKKRNIDFISLYTSLQRALRSFNDQAGC